MRRESFSSIERASEDTDSLDKRKYDTISDEDRLKLILMIKDPGMSCHKASKVLNIAYNNAKVIYRIYKQEKRIRQTPKEQKRHAKTIRVDLLRKREKERKERVEALMDENSSEETGSAENDDFAGADEIVAFENAFECHDTS